MAHVPVVPIGNPRDTVVDQGEYDAGATGHTIRSSAELDERRHEVQAGWGDEYVERVHEKDKLTTRERLEASQGPGSASSSRLAPSSTTESTSMGFALPRPVSSPRSCKSRGPLVHVVIANDNTVASGAWWPKTPEKIERAQEMARRLRLPTLYLVDCSGLYLPEQSKSFAGATGAGHIFKMNSLLSAEGVPQIAGVFRRLHRRRRVHADHQRPRVHDRAGLHGHCGRGPDQGSEEPTHHLARHRWAGGARPPIGLRRRACPRRRHA